MSGPWYGPIANNGKLWHSMLSNCSHPSYSYSRFQSDVKPSKLVRPRRHSSFYPLCSSHPFRDTEVRHTAMCALTIYSVSASLRLTSPKCEIGAIFLVISAWIRYAGTTGSLSSSSAYGLLIFASVRQYITQSTSIVTLTIIIMPDHLCITSGDVPGRGTYLLREMV